MSTPSDHRLNDRELLRRVDAGATQAELAKEFGITRQAIFKRLKHLRRRTTKAIVGGKRRRDLVDQRLDTI